MNPRARVDDRSRIEALLEAERAKGARRVRRAGQLRRTIGALIVLGFLTGAWLARLALLDRTSPGVVLACGAAIAGGIAVGFALRFLARWSGLPLPRLGIASVTLGVTAVFVLLVTFDEATTVRGDALSITYLDPDHVGESRFLTFGHSSGGRRLAVAHTERGDKIRIISAREMTPRKRRDYESF